MPTWPGSLPQYPLQDGYSAAEPNGLLASAMDQGPPKVRRRFSAAVTPVQCSWKLTDAQKATLKAFVKTDLAGGALTFTWPNPEDPPNTCAARFNPERLPVYAASGRRWLATAEVWILP